MMMMMKKKKQEREDKAATNLDKIIIKNTTKEDRRRETRKKEKERREEEKKTPQKLRMMGPSNPGQHIYTGAPASEPVGGRRETSREASAAVENPRRGAIINIGLNNIPKTKEKR